jgi:hypothetical protein
LNARPAAASAALEQHSAATGGGRTLRSYLLLPRPKDSVKWWILPLTFALGVLASGGVSATELARAAVVWFALELLIYQARYQWNDVRGFAADQAHPDAASRGRLPGPIERARPHIAASLAVAMARLAAAAGLIVLLPSLDLATPLVALAVAVFGVAVVYEALREHATGRSSEVPPALRPSIVALWVFVGAGYAIRGVAGLALAVDLGGEPTLAVAAVITMWSFGIAFVTARWALEALAFARADGGRLEWSVRREQAREHTLALARWIPLPPPDSRASDWRPAAWHALAGHTAASAPWNLAAVVAAGAAAATGLLLAGSVSDLAVAAAAVAGALAASAVLAAPRRQGLVLAALAATAIAALAAADAPRPLIAVLPWLAILGAHLFFKAQSLETLGHPLRGAVSASMRSAR